MAGEFSMKNPWQATFFVLFIGTCVHIAGSLSLFVARKHLHPVKGHSTALISLLCVSGALLSLTICTVYIGLKVQCWLYFVTVFGGVTIGCVVFILRSWRIYVYYDLQSKKIDATRLRVTHAPDHESGSSVAPAAMNQGFSESALYDNGNSTMHFAAIARFYRWFTDRNFFLLALFVSLTALALEGIPFYLQYRNAGDYGANGKDQCPELDGSIRVVLGVVCVFAAVLFFTVWKLRGTYDGYMIKNELRLCAIWGSLTILTLALHFLLEDVRPLQIAKVVLVNGLVFSSTTWKVLATFGLCVGKRVKAQVARSKDTSSDNRSIRLSTITSRSDDRVRSTKAKFQAVLDNPRTRTLFKEHLKREWSVENILFYEAIEDFKVMLEDRTVNSEVLLRVAMEIFKTYVDEDSPTTANIPSDIRVPLEEWYATVRELEGCVSDEQLEAGLPANLYDDAFKEMYNLMRADSFIRFQLGGLYQKYLQEEDEARRSFLKDEDAFANVRGFFARTLQGRQQTRIKTSSVDVAHSVKQASVEMSTDESKC